MKTIFITRDLNETSFFKQMLEKTGFRVYGQSLIEFTPVPFQFFPSTDWLFFYSKNGIKYFGINGGFNQLNVTKLATIGQPSANFLKQHFNLKADFIGTGDPEITATLFLQVAHNQSVLFPRAKHSRQSIQRLLIHQITAHDLVVYNNQKAKLPNLPTADILVFTSPVNAEAYFESNPKLTNQKIISIGKTTGQKLKSIGIIDFKIADVPSEEGLVRAVLDVI